MYSHSVEIRMVNFEHRLLKIKLNERPAYVCCILCFSGKWRISNVKRLRFFSSKCSKERERERERTCAAKMLN